MSKDNDLIYNNLKDIIINHSKWNQSKNKLHRAKQLHNPLNFLSNITHISCVYWKICFLGVTTTYNHVNFLPGKHSNQSSVNKKLKWLHMWILIK